MRGKTYLRTALTAILLLLAIWPAMAQQDVTLTISRIAGTVEVRHAVATKGEWQKAKKDQQIGGGWTLRTGADGKAQLVFPKNNVVILKASSVLTVDKLDSSGGASVGTSGGGMLVDIRNALSPGSEFEVKTPSAQAVVRGTKYGLEFVPASGSGGGSGMNFMLGPGIEPRRALSVYPSFGLLLGSGKAQGEGQAQLQFLDLGEGLPAFLSGRELVRLGVLSQAEAAAAAMGDARVVEILPGGRATERSADVDGDGTADLALSDLDGDGLGDLLLGDLNGDGESEVAFGVGDLDGDGLGDYELALAALPDGMDGSGAESQISPKGALLEARVPGADALAALRGAVEDGRELSDEQKEKVEEAYGQPLSVPNGGTGGAVEPDAATDQQQIKQAEVQQADEDVDAAAPTQSGGPHVRFFGFEGTVEISNPQGTSMLTEGTTVDVRGRSTPGSPTPSGDEAADFLSDAEDTEAFDDFEAAAATISASINPIRAALQEDDRKLGQYEVDFAMYVRRGETGKMKLVFAGVGELEDDIHEQYDKLWKLLGQPGNKRGMYEEMTSAMQEQGVTDTDLPPLIEDLLRRIEAFLLDLSPYMPGEQELEDRLQGLIGNPPPQLGLRYDLIDTDNDGIGDALEAELGTDPLLNNRNTGFIELLAPDDGEVINFPPDAPLTFEYEALDTDVELLYSLVLEAGGQQAVRRNARESERFTLAGLAGPTGLLGGAVDPATGTLEITWHVEAQLRRATGRGLIPPITSEVRTLTIQLPANQVVEVNLSAGTPGNGLIGRQFSVFGSITQVNALGEWRIEVSYDPQLVSFAQGNKRDLLNPHTVFFNDTPGLLTISGRASGLGGVTGAGQIFELVFNLNAEGQADFEVRDVELRDAAGTDIDGRPGDDVSLLIRRTSTPSVPTVPTTPGGAAGPAGPVVTPGSSQGSAGLPPLGPLTLTQPLDGEVFDFPGDEEISFGFDLLDTRLDVDYNLILSAGGQQKVWRGFSRGDSIRISELFAAGSPFAAAKAGSGLVELEWCIEAEVDSGAGQPTKIRSDKRRLSIQQLKNETVTVDLSASGKVSKLQRGDTVKIRASLSEVNGLAKWQILVHYDQSVLEFRTGRKLGLFSAASVRFDSAGYGKLAISGSASGVGVSGNGDVVELEFRALNDGDAVVEPDPQTMTDVLGNSINVAAGDDVEINVLTSSVPGGGPAGPGGKFP